MLVLMSCNEAYFNSPRVFQIRFHSSSLHFYLCKKEHSTSNYKLTYLRKKNMPQNEHNFYGLGIAPAILSVIERLKFTVPTKIQFQAIPIGLQGQDVMGIAQTGTGKTMAFGIPLIQRLDQIKGRALVVVPTRELAIQVDESLRKIATALGLKTAVLIGGDSMGKQLQTLKSQPRILIGTPGRLIDHMQQKTLNFQDCHILSLMKLTVCSIWVWPANRHPAQASPP